MKIIKIIIEEIKTFVNRETKIFITIFIGLIISLTVLIYVHSLALNKYQEHFELPSYRNYEIVTNEDNGQVSIINDLIEKIKGKNKLPSLETIYLSSKSTPLEKFEIEQEYTLGGYYSEIPGKYDTHYSVYSDYWNFTQEEVKSNKNILLIHHDIFMELNDKRTDSKFRLSINNEKFEVIGTLGRTKADFIMPLETYLDNEFATNNIELTFKERLNDEEYTIFANILDDTFPQYNITLPREIILDAGFYLLVTFAGLLAIMASFSISYFFKYWLEKNKKNFLMYRICGASKLDVYILILSQLLLIVMAAFIAFLGLYSIGQMFLTDLTDYDIFIPLNFSSFIFALLIIYISQIFSIFSKAKLFAKLSIIKTEGGE